MANFFYLWTQKTYNRQKPSRTRISVLASISKHIANEINNNKLVKQGKEEASILFYTQFSPICEDNKQTTKSLRNTVI